MSQHQLALRSDWAEAWVIETPRLRLRPARLDDLTDTLALWRDPATLRHMTIKSMSDEDIWRRLLMRIGHWQALGFGFWSVARRSDGAFVGEFGLCDFQRQTEPAGMISGPEAGWAVIPAMQAQGYAGEALQAVLQWAARAWPGTTIDAIISPANLPSQRLAERLGFVGDGRAGYAGELVEVWRVRSSA